MSLDSPLRVPAGPINRQAIDLASVKLLPLLEDAIQKNIRARVLEVVGDTCGDAEALSDDVRQSILIDSLGRDFFTVLPDTWSGKEFAVHVNAMNEIMTRLGYSSRLLQKELKVLLNEIPLESSIFTKPGSPVFTPIALESIHSAFSIPTIAKETETHLHQGEIDSMLQSIILSLASGPQTAADLLQRFRSWLTTLDLYEVEQSIRHGFAHMTSMRSVTAEEWEATHFPKDPKNPPSVTLDGTTPFIRDSIQAGALRKQLTALKKSEKSKQNNYAIEAQEMAIVYTVFAQLMKLPYITKVAPSMTTYNGGTPKEAVKYRAMTCASGPWLMAAQMIDAGIPPEQIFLCITHEQQSTGHYQGTHGSLIFYSTMQKLFHIDPSHHALTQVPASYLCASEQDDIQAMRDGKRKDPIRMTIHSQAAEHLKLPKVCDILPIDRGITSMHMLHVGIRFFYEEQYEEADRAFHMCLAYHPSYVDALYFVALIRMRQKKVVEAVEILKKSLNALDSFTPAMFSLGEIAAFQGRVYEASDYFIQVLEDIRPSWIDKDGAFKAKAKQYLIQHQTDPCVENLLDRMRPFLTQK